MNRTVRVFDGHWQQDLTNLDLSGDRNNGRWDIAGSYFYDKRQNLSSEGVDIDGILPFNHAAGMLQARLVLAKFSDLDALAVDHVIITLEVYMTAFRLSLVSRETIQSLFRAVETLYRPDSTGIYDRLFEFENANNYFKILPRVANWLSIGTSLQEKFANFTNTVKPTENLHIREYEAVLSYYGSERLSIFLAP